MGVGGALVYSNFCVLHLAAPGWCSLLRRFRAHATLPLQSSAGGVTRRLSRSSMQALSSMVPKGLAMRSAKSAPALEEDGAVCTALATCTGNWLSHVDWGQQR